jgi:hypothetical protein
MKRLLFILPLLCAVVSQAATLTSPPASVESYTSRAANNSLASGTYSDLVSISLPSGVWDISAMGHVDGSGGSSIADFIIAVSTTSGNTGTGLLEGYSKATGGAAGNGVDNVAIPRVILTISATTTIYGKCYSDWSGGAGISCTVGVTARRIQ